MTKTLYILRHAHAVSAADGDDRNRSLSSKGAEDAAALGVAMRGKNYTPDIVACSPALRTMQTYEHVMRVLPKVLILSPDYLYNAMTGDLVSCIQDIKEEYDRLLLVAHNPSIHELAIWLSDPQHAVHLHRLGAYAPATLCVFECSCSKWADIQPRANRLIDVMETMDYNFLV